MTNPQLAKVLFHKQITAIILLLNIFKDLFS